MKNKAKKFVVGMLLVAAMGTISVNAARIAYDSFSLSTPSGTATISCGLYTTSLSSTPYLADTRTSISVGESRVTKLYARVISSPSVVAEAGTHDGYVEVNAYGKNAFSTHEAYSSTDFDYCDLPQEP